MEIEGKDARRLRKDLEALISSDDAESPALRSREVRSLYARGDEKNMRSYMRAKGFYNATISHVIESNASATVRYTITSGPLFMLESPVLLWSYDDREAGRIVTNHFTARTDDRLPASSQNMILLRQEAVRVLQESGYPEAKARLREITVDHHATNATVQIEIDPGPRAILGRAKLAGNNQLKRIRTGYLDKAQAWSNSQPYDIRTVEEFEQQLAASGLFASIIAKAVPTDTNVANTIDPVYDIELTLQERKHRTMELGVGYTTDKGAESSARWQHRNMLGQGENFVLRGNINEEGFETETRFTVPFLYRHDQRWISSLLVREEETDAYVTRGVETAMRIARNITPALDAQLGAALYYLRERQAGEEDNFLLLSTPFDVDWNKTDSTLDARQGFRLIWETEPYTGLKEPDMFFWKNLVTARGYMPLKRNKHLALASRITAGYITGDKLGDIPAETRFYAGGGTSVRGYAYQSLSPRENDLVIGGMSLFESSFEVRAQATEKLGFVLFLDGGSSFEKEIQMGGAEYRWGAGAGMRYFTPVGPIRADAGFPLEPRDTLDDDWQFYISIGQAF